MTRAADTNQAESFFSRLRRAEIGQHQRIGVHLHQYAGEMAWREDNRRKPDRDPVHERRRRGAGASGQPAVGRILAAERRLNPLRAGLSLHLTRQFLVKVRR